LDIFWQWLVFPLVTLFHPAVVSSTPFLAERPMFPLQLINIDDVPPLTKIDFSKIPLMFEKPKLLTASFFITWIIGPFLMFSLATFFLKDYPEYMTGLIIIGIAPCTMVVWNELAGK
jgi:hypothetical protein